MQRAAIFMLLILAGAAFAAGPSTVEMSPAPAAFQPGQFSEHIDAMYDRQGNLIATDIDGTDGVSMDSLYWKNYASTTYLYYSAKATSPSPTTRTAMSFQNSQATACMDPNGDYVYEVNGANLRRFSTVDGSYTNYTLSYTGGNGCATDGQYIYVPSSSNSASIYKYTMTGTYVNTTTLNYTADAYAISCVNDTVWACPSRYAYTYYGYAAGRFTGGSITNDATWYVGTGTNGVGNIAYDGTYYYVPWIGTSPITFKRFYANRTLYTTGTVSIDPRSVMCKKPSYQVSGDSLYFHDYSYSFLRVAPKVTSPTAINAVPMTWVYNQTVTGMTPDGQYVYEVYGTQMRRYSTINGGYSSYTLSYSGGGACGTDGQYVYVSNGSSVYKYSMTGTYVNTTTVNYSATPYGFAVARDTVWLTTSWGGSVTYYGYACSRFTGGSITNDASWTIASTGGSTPMNIAWDGQYYYIASGGYTTNPFFRYYGNRTLYTSGTFNGDARSVMCKGPYTNGVMIAHAYGTTAPAVALRQLLADSCGGTFGTVGTYDVRVNATFPATDWYNMGYRAILVYSDYNFNNGTSLGDSLARFVQLGGGVVDAVFADQTGIEIGGLYRTRYRCLTANSNSYTNGSLGSARNHNPTHPIMTGVDTMYMSSYITACQHSSLRSSNCTCLADWSGTGNRVQAACFDSSGQRTASLGFAPHTFYIATANGRWVRQIVNALRWVSHTSPEPNVGVTRILAPTGNIDSGQVAAPACSVYNFGNTTPATYNVRMRIGAYNQIAAVTSHAPGTRAYVTFSNWTALVRGSNAVSCSTELTGDVTPSNDKLTGTVNVNVTDVSCSHLVVPTGNVDSGSTVTPACSLRNLGTTTPATYTVRMKIGAGYNQQATVTSHAPGTIIGITFPTWVATVPRGSYATSCSTELNTDVYPANNKQTGTCEVVVSDVGATAIIAPTGSIAAGTPVAPSARVKNFGSAPATFDLRFVIDNGADVPVYDTTETGLTLAAGDSLARTFTKTWVANPTGNYTTKAWTILAGDPTPANDTARGTCTVVSSGPVGWSEKAAMPTTPSGKYMKDGGWLAWEEGTDLIYAAKGNKVGDFYSYDPVANAWTPKALMPTGTEAKPPYKGSVGCGGDGMVYCTKGNNTQGFWRYSTATDSWKQLADVPLGLSNKKVKGGTDAVFVTINDTNYVYLLKGYKNEFYRYSIALDSWQSLPDAPGTLNVKWSAGSWLAAVEYDPVKLYAHQAKYHGFYAFDVTAGTWGPALKGMPFISRSGKSKKSKDGGCGVWDDTDIAHIFALKGGNTQEFWRYTPGGDSWTELDTLPVYGSTMKKKKVKAGGDIVSDGDGALFATKGNKCNELWQYRTGAVMAPRPERSGVMASVLERPVSGLSISPNPLATGFATLRFGLPRAGAVAVGIFDVTGRRVFESNLVVSSSGATSLDLRHLSAGVYLVKLSSGDFASSQKLVIER